MYRNMFLVCVLLCLAGCAGRQNIELKTMDRKAHSLATYGPDTIHAVVPFPERPGSENDVRPFAPRNYLSAHSGVLVVGDGFTEESFRAQFDNRNESVTDAGINLKIEFNGKDRGGVAGCTAITRDGYLLTAGHSMDYENTYAIYVSSDETHSYASGGKCRLVQRFEQSDMALLKVAIDTPRYLRFAADPLEKDDEVFGGNIWIGQAAAGRFLRDERVSYPDQDISPEDEFHYTTMPSLPGDSGSPLVNLQGELCGIVVAGEDASPFGLVLGKRTGSLAARIDKVAIEAAIEKDRAASNE